MTIKISDTPPIPKDHKDKKHRMRKSDRQDAIGQLKVGQSFTLKTSSSSVSVLIWWAQAKYEGREFTSKVEKPYVRIWRTA